MRARPTLLALLAATTPLPGWAADRGLPAVPPPGLLTPHRVLANGLTALPDPILASTAAAVAARVAATLALPAATLPVGPGPRIGFISYEPPTARPGAVLSPDTHVQPVSAWTPSRTTAARHRAAKPKAPVRSAQARPAPAVAPPPPGVSAPTPAPPSAPDAVAARPLPEPALVSAGVPASPPVQAAIPALDAAIGTALRQPAAAPAPEETVIEVLAGTELGVAAYGHDDRVIIVFDQRVPIDAAQLRSEPGDPATAQVVTGPNSTVLMVPWPPGTPLSIARRGRAWQITAAPDTATPHPLAAIPADRRMELRTEQPGRVVTIVDPVDGRTLLIGTARGTEGGRPFVAAPFRAPEYTLVPSVLGVVVEPLSDAIDLRQIAHGFAITSQDDLTPVAAAQASPASLASRRFDLPALPTAALVRRLQAEFSAAAAAAPRARAAPRMMAAQSLISLGLGIEAQSILALTAIEDPAAATDPNLMALQSMAALLAGRPAEAQGLDEPALDGSDEIALWRAVRAALRDGSMNYDAALLPVALGYSNALRARLAPVLADAAAIAGDDAALTLIDAASPGLPAVRLAQATRLAQAGPPAPALAMLDELRTSPDRRTATRAEIASAELQLHGHQITPTQAADVLERTALAWRGDGQEAALRQRIVALRMEAGSWRAALEGVRALSHLSDSADTREQAAVQTAMQDRVGAVFRAMLVPGAAPIPPLDFVALVSEFADGLPPGQDVTTALADHLMELDLPLRARAVLTPLLQSTPPGPVRAGIGARVAQLALDVGAPKEAQAALGASETPDVSPALMEQRVLLAARARAAREDRAGAVAQLTGLGTAAADDLRATLLTEAGDWPGALAALDALASKAVPAEGPLPDAAQEIVLRQAGAAVQSNNMAALTALRDRIPRMDERRGGLLRLLTAPPVTGSIDIARAGQELALGRTVPGRSAGLANR